MVINYRQNWLQKAGVEPVSGVSCGRQQGQGACPPRRGGNVSRRGSDHACAPGLAQIRGKARATDAAQNISVPGASTLIFPRRPVCNFHRVNKKVTWQIPWR